MALLSGSVGSTWESKDCQYLGGPAPVKQVDYKSSGDSRPGTTPRSINSREGRAWIDRSLLPTSRANELDSKLDSKRLEASANILSMENSIRTSSGAAESAQGSTKSDVYLSRSQAPVSAIESDAKVERNNPVDPLDDLLYNRLQLEGVEAGSRLVLPSSKFNPDAKLHSEPLLEPITAYDQASSKITAQREAPDSLYKQILQGRSLELKTDKLSLHETPDSAKSTDMPSSANHEAPWSPWTPSDRDGLRSPVFGNVGSIISNTSGETPLSPTLSDVKTPRSRRSSASGASNNKPRFDLLTLREWFIEMDEQKHGSVTKTQWLNFMRKHPGLIKVMVGGSDTTAWAVKDRFSEEGRKQLTELARQLKELRVMFSVVDEDKSGTIEFEEFVEFFRKIGFFLEYKTDQNARLRLAHMLGEACEKEANDREETDKRQKEFTSLSSQHLQGGQKRRMSDTTILSSLLK